MVSDEVTACPLMDSTAVSVRQVPKVEHISNERFAKITTTYSRVCGTRTRARMTVDGVVHDIMLETTVFCCQFRQCQFLQGPFRECECATSELLNLLVREKRRGGEMNQYT